MTFSVRPIYNTTREIVAKGATSLSAGIDESIYQVNPEHKRDPRYLGAAPRSAPRPKLSLRDDSRILHTWRALTLLLDNTADYFQVSPLAAKYAYQRKAA